VKTRNGYNKDIVTAYFKSMKIPVPSYEYKFYDGRNWRLDIAWPYERLCIEVQGGIFVYGRHSRGAALLKEWEKLNTLASLGWRVLYCQPRDLCMMETCKWILAALAWRHE
jgi:hypothetical protein